MVKSTERNKEYYVVLQPRNREHPPIFMKGWAKNEKDAINGAFNADWHKEVLGVIEVSDTKITEDICEEYWNMYGIYKPNKLNEVQYF